MPHSRPEVAAIAYPRGRGPVYVGLGTGGVVHYTEDNRVHRGWYYHKTLWAIAPEYPGSVTITGYRLGRPNGLLFNPAAGFPGRKVGRLRVPPDSGGWRYGPSDTLIRSPGCYVFEIRGSRLRRFITFLARP